jgi:hypothetical protein
MNAGTDERLSAILKLTGIFESNAVETADY